MSGRAISSRSWTTCAPTCCRSSRRPTCGPASGRSRRSAAAATRTPRSSSPSTGRISRSSRSSPARSPTAASKEPGVVDVDTSLNVGKPELSVHLDRLKAADLGVQDRGRGRSAAAAGRRRPGDDLQRRGRAVRGARPRRRRAIARRRGDRAADGAVDARRQRAAREPGALHAGHVADRDQPAEPAAAGDDLRGPAAGRLADAGDGRDDEGGRVARTWDRATAPGSRAGRGSSGARRRTS